MERLVVVTGTSRGLGKAIALECLKRGAHVEGISRGEGAIDHGSYTHTRADLSVEEQGYAVFGLIRDRWDTLDQAVLVNNAGIYHSQPVAELRPSEVSECLEANLRTAVTATLAFLQRFGRGKIIFLSAYNAITPSSGSAAYGTAKAAVSRFSRSLRMELPRENYLIATLFPGSINTWSEDRVPETINVAEMASLIADFWLVDKTFWVEEVSVQPRSD